MKAIIIKDLILFILGLIIGFTFQINPLLSISLIIILIPILYVILSELFNIPILKIYNIILTYYSEKDQENVFLSLANKKMYDFLYFLLNSYGNKIRFFRKRVDVGDLNNTKQIVFSSTKKDLIELSKEFLSKFKENYKEENNNYSLIKVTLGLIPKAWIVKSYSTTMEYWHVGNIKIEILGEGVKATYQTLRDQFTNEKKFTMKIKSKNHFELSRKIDGYFDFKISVIQEGSFIDIIVFFNEFGGLELVSSTISDCKELIQIYKTINLIIKNIKKYHKKQRYISKFKGTYAESKSKKSEQKAIYRIIIGKITDVDL